MLIYKAMNVFPSAIREVVLEEYAADVAGPMRIRKRSATQVRFDDPLPLEVELTRPRSDADALRRRIEESVWRAAPRPRRCRTPRLGAIPVGEQERPHLRRRGRPSACLDRSDRHGGRMVHGRSDAVLSPTAMDPSLTRPAG